MTEKKKRYRKNKKWIPYKQLTPEEREMLRRESNRKQLRKELLERKMRVNAAESSGDYSLLSMGPVPTNEDYLYDEGETRKSGKWDNVGSDEEEFRDSPVSAEEQQLFVDPDNILNDTQVKEETIEDRVRRQFAEIRKLEKIHDTLQEELYELDHLMKQYAAQM
ncbi:hypothetical protein WA538_005126 [Blastocystis sp. DL]